MPLSRATQPDPKPDPLGVEARREAIVAAVRQRGFATIEALATSFGVTVQTIRRDLNELSAEGRLERYRGGGGLPSRPQTISDNRINIQQIDDHPARLTDAKVVCMITHE